MNDGPRSPLLQALVLEHRDPCMSATCCEISIVTVIYHTTGVLWLLNELSPGSECVEVPDLYSSKRHHGC